MDDTEARFEELEKAIVKHKMLPKQAGRPGLPAEIKALMKTRRGEVSKDIADITKMSKAQIEELVNDPEAEGMRVAIAAVMLRAMNAGEARSLGVLFDRLLGKVRDHRLG